MLYIALGFVAPMLAYLALYTLSKRKDFGRLTFTATALLAVIPLIATLDMVFSSSYWREGTRVVWTGLTVASGKPLMIGGPPEQSVVGWPNGDFTPSLKVTSIDGRRAAIEVAGGEAFVYDDNTKDYFNGRTIPAGSSSSFGDYAIRVSHPFPWFLKARIEVLGSDGKMLADVSMQTFGADKERVRSLKNLIDNSIVEDLTRLDRVVEMDDLKEWAAGIRLLLTAEGDIRVLDQETSEPVERQLPARLIVNWMNQRLPVDISFQDGRLAADFESPWRLSCPIPPHDEDKDVVLTVTGRPLPGEKVFLLPLGRDPEIQDMRKTISFSAKEPYQFQNEASVPDGRSEGYLHEGEAKSRRRVGLSRLGVESGSYSFELSIVKDLPSRWGVVFLCGLAWFCLVAGLWLSYPRMADGNRWVVHGLALTIWTFMVFRVLLALRYILDPNSMDSLSLKGVTYAFVGMAVVPGLILLLARLRCDWYQGPDEQKGAIRVFLLVFAYLVFLAIAFLIEFYSAPNLWSGLPLRYSSSLGLFFSVVFLSVCAYLAGYARFLYDLEPDRKLKRFFVEPWERAEAYLEKRRLDFEKMRRKQGTAALPPRMHYVRIYAGALLYFTTLPFLLHLLPGSKFSQEVVVPLVFYWTPALWWIAWRLYFAPDARGPKSYRKLIWMILIAIPTILFPMILVPVFIGDVGSILAILAVFLPLGLVLLAAPRRNFQAGAAVCVAVAIGLAAGGLFYSNLDLVSRNLDWVPGFSSKLKTAEVRLLNFREGSYIQRYVLWSNSVRGADAEGLPYQDLMNGYQHSWENKAIAHEGGETGLGFGNAPTRRSQIRQDTLQYDSAFSFFIVSEYGFWGGMFMLALYGMPLVIILVGGRRRFDAGYAMALLIAASFLVEAVFHAGMNLGAFPMTGRSLPLITVNSLSELIRWTILFALAVQAVFWRYRGKGMVKDEAISLITSAPPVQAQQADDGAPKTEVIIHTPEVEPRLRYLKLCCLTLIVPLVLGAAVFAAGDKVVRDQEGELKEFGYSYILRNVQHLIDTGRIRLDQQTLTIDIDESRVEELSDTQFIQQQKARFNAMKRDEKIEEVRQENVRFLQDGLAQVRTVEAYQALLYQFRKKSMIKREKRKVTLFRLEAVPDYDSEDSDSDTKEYRVVKNPDFNVSLRFTVGEGRDNVPQVALSGTKPQAGRLIIGPAWVMGRWISAIDPNEPLPWLTYLREALESEWKRLGGERAGALYGTLTIDEKLNANASEFVANKGAHLHQEILDGNRRTNSYVKKLPPRVALSIIALPSGDTLALSGWPHMTSDDSWKKGAGAAGWVPPLKWLDREAPRSIQSRYGGDRNFERALLMGSSTKPLWATAVLAVHSNLDRQLRVRGPAGEETDAFGIGISPGWEVHGSEGWVDFNHYLSDSDNRYQVRLGLLGLAEDSGGNVVTAGQSNSEKESLDQAGAVWRKYPKFPVKIGFSENNTRVMLNLHETDLAHRLKSMYSIGIGRNDFARRVSFWTKNERDDLAGESVVDSDRPTVRFQWISPEAPQFAFDDFRADRHDRKGPRDFVTMLLGGGTNLWSNVDFASAFATCVTGSPVIAHIVRNQEPVRPLKERNVFTEIAAKVRPGLAAVVTEGTAFRTLRKSPIGLNALAWLNSHPGLEVFAKTGTLKSEEGSRNTSRIVLTLIKWKDKKKGLVESGLVFSIVAERAKVGLATEWLAEFLSTYRNDVERVLSSH